MGFYFNVFLVKMKKFDVYFKRFKNYIFMIGLDFKLDKIKDLVNCYIIVEFV